MTRDSRHISWLNRLTKSDAVTEHWISSHANLLLLLACSAISVYAVAHGQSYLLATLALIGAVGYFTGLSTALILSTLCVIGNGILEAGASNAIATLMLDAVSYVAVAWLGYRHKMQQLRQRLQVMHQKESQVLPWAMVNEVRTSLAALRFLLFPLHDQQQAQTLYQVTQELSRLEALFTEAEQQNLKPRSDEERSLL